MPIRLPRLASIALASSLFTTACAQTTATAPQPPPVTTTVERAVGVADPQQARVRAALDAAEAGRFDPAAFTDLGRHPLYGWIEYADLRGRLDALPQAQADAFLQRYRGQAVAGAFREAWLGASARRGDWTAVRAAWPAAPDAALLANPALRCAELSARQAAGAVDAQWVRDAQALWRTGKPLPDVCDAPIAVLAGQGGLPASLRWDRIDLAAEAGQPGVIRAAARGLPDAEAALAGQYAAFLEAVDERALAWPRTERSRRIASLGLARLAKDAPDRAEALLPRYADALGFGEADRARVLYAVALWTVASYGPESARRLAAVPASAYDARLHEWQAREALARSDWPAALAAIRRMPAAQRGDSRWQYFEARLAALTGDDATAQRLYAAAALKPEFHGFLAADRIGQPYALCPWTLDGRSATRAQVAADPAIRRAMALYQMQRGVWAEREWNEALARFDDAQRRYAVDVAQDYGWFDRAVFALGKGNPDELRLYELRFPLHHAESIRRAAASSAIDPAWVAAEIRAESVFNPTARSGANAMGLMQVVPATGMAVAQRLGLPWSGADRLLDPDTNITVGTAYLRQLLDGYGEGRPYLTIAGYNAGPTPLARWKSQRPGMDADFWIETVSYKETRDYVARVLAFSVIYDWRLGGNARSLSDRMVGRMDGPAKRFACPLPAMQTVPATPGSAMPPARRK